METAYEIIQKCLLGLKRLWREEYDDAVSKGILDPDMPSFCPNEPLYNLIETMEEYQENHS